MNLKSLEGCWRSLIEALPQNIPGRTEKITRPLGASTDLTQIRKGQLQNIELGTCALH